MDHIIKRTRTQGAYDRGPLFKLDYSSLDLLFPPSKHYDLLASVREVSWILFVFRNYRSYQKEGRAISWQKRPVSEKDLRGVLQELGDQFSNLLDHQLFVLWFARAMLTSTEEEAAGTLTGVARDKGIDAIYIDDGTKGVFLIQGKYRKGIGKRTEKRDEVWFLSALLQSPSW